MALEAKQKYGYVRLFIVPTGEVLEFRVAGIDRNVTISGEVFEDEFRETSLEIALRLVPILEVAIDSARMRNRCIDVQVSDGIEARIT